MKLRFSLALIVAVAACNEVEMFPVGTGGGGPPGGTTTPDAASNDGSGGDAISGRVCVIEDARNPTTCAAAGADGLTVLLGTAITTTAADGSFTIARSSASGLVWRVSGNAIQASAMQLGTVHTIPAISAPIFQDMVTSTSAITGDGTGSIIARFTMGTAGVSGLAAITSPNAEGQIYYDGNSAVAWQTNATGNFGVVWAPGILPPDADMTVTGSHTGTLVGIPVFADTVTFVFASVQ